VKINNLDTCCEQVGRRGKDYEKEVVIMVQTFGDTLSVTSSRVKKSKNNAYFVGLLEAASCYAVHILYVRPVGPLLVC
jgi:hypothetical protein